MKHFVIIVIAVVAMIGMMTPSVFAELKYPKSYLMEELSDIRVDRYLPRGSEDMGSFQSASTGNTFDSLKFKHSNGYSGVSVVVQIFQTNEDAIKHNESKISKLLQQTEYYAEEAGWFWAPSGCTIYLENRQIIDKYHVKCVMDNYRILVSDTYGDEELIKKYAEKVIEIIANRPLHFETGSAIIGMSGGATLEAPYSEDGMYGALSTDARLVCKIGTIPQDGKCVSKESNQSQIDLESEGGGCLIATATYGSELAPQVQQLRELRDNQLLNTESGTVFMTGFNQIYYSFSPIISDLERENPIFKEMVKVIITPMISSLSILNYVEMDSEESVLGYGILLIILNGMMYVGIPILAVMRFKK